MYRIGIDVGGTNIAAGLVDKEGNILFKKSIPTVTDKPIEEIVLDMAGLALEIIKTNSLEEKDIISIGIGNPGTPDVKNGIMIYSNNIPYKNTNIRQIFSGITKTPVYIDNDANCAALGEATSGGAKGYADSITVTLGTGVGGGIIINGKIYSGHNYAGGELGHHVIMMGGEQCSCGRKGCFEAYASATALIRDTKKAASLHPDSKINSICDNNTENIDAKTVFIAKRAGDPYAAELVDNYIRYLGEGISNIINIFQPDIVLIGGGISKEGDGLLNPLREFVRHNTYKSEGISKTLIRQAVLGNDAGIIGAAMLG